MTATVLSETTADSSAFSNAVMVTSADADHDGMPDAYEASIPGLSPANAADANGDLDDDGVTNLNEFLAGTDPRDGSSRLFASGQREGGIFVLSFPSIAGVTYRAERADTLPGPWTKVAIHIAGTGSLVDVPVPMTPSQGHEFFRVTTGE